MKDVIQFSIPVRLVLAGCLSSGLMLAAADPVNKDRAGVALKGHDPVAYFTGQKAVKGSARFTHEWMGARWQFVTAGNRDAFAANPEQYAPQFGGYCAWAVSRGYTADIDPEAWKIVDGELYLNYSKDVQKKWEQDIPKRIEEGNRNWPKLHK
jgi:YHS domain-containing protein